MVSEDNSLRPLRYPSVLAYHMPLYFFQLYLGVTVFLFAFGPWRWPTENDLALYIFLAVAQLALWLGYRSGIRRFQLREVCSIGPTKFLHLSIAVSLAWVLPSYHLSMGGVGDMSFANLLQSAALGLSDPAARYTAKVEATAISSGSTPLGYLTELISPLLWATLPLTVLYWSRLNVIPRILACAAIALDVASWIALGTNKGLFDFVIVLSVLVAAKWFFRPGVGYGRPLFKVAFVAAILTAAAITYFAAGQEGRGGSTGLGYDSYAGIGIDDDNWLFRVLPESWKLPSAALVSYLSQGYYPLSLALSQDFQFSFGVGHSYYYTGIIQSFLGPDVVSDRTYPAAIEQFGWDRLSKWHSIYPWIASDLTFPGTIVFVFLIGRLLALTWLGTAINRDPVAAVLLSLVAIMLFYFPANNQVLAFSKTANTFWAALIYWLWINHRAKAG